MKWRTRKKGSPKQKGLKFPTRKDFQKAKRKPSWKRRPGYLLRGGKVQAGVFEDYEMKPVEDGQVEGKGSLKRGYKTPDQTCPDLTPSKAVQREQLAKKVKGGTVLETHAGKGELSEAIYSKEADKIVMIDKNAKLLKKADKRLDRKVRHEAVVSDNVRWLSKEMEPKKLKKLKLVDFDAFGCPADSMRAFFKHFPVKRKMYVAVTDGSKIWLGYKKGKPKEQAEWMRKHYGIVRKSKGTREDQIKLLDAFMKAQGQVRGFKVKPVNVAYGKHHTVYAGYELSPK